MGAEFQRLSPDCFAGYDNASFKQHFLDDARAQREPKVGPDGMGDNLWRKPMALVADRQQGHAYVTIRSSSHSQNVPS
jgi:hypothetical protein